MLWSLLAVSTPRLKRFMSYSLPSALQHSTVSREHGYALAGKTAIVRDEQIAVRSTDFNQYLVIEVNISLGIDIP